ncbi:helix-turn-helix domain-containing protein [Empedobacter sedimenti]|uniref:helix-turn-helix domain-containing protein n=1 Tax=Empedobacter sedimenti TaxID=3042610 RepID=UPI0024A75696|nr:helix-turn-helix domain-containing protein [Empedobacter sedimenti]
MQPDYKKIYTLMIEKKFPEKLSECAFLLEKDQLNNFDVQSIQRILFNKQLNFIENQQFKAYDKETMIKILTYQKENGLNNSEAASYFKMSRNTIAKWRKDFKDEEYII